MFIAGIYSSPIHTSTELLLPHIHVYNYACVHECVNCDSHRLSSVSSTIDQD